ncbi:hypothetical protein SEA_JUNG_10 [Mycobacterium phage Jung]|uniref:Uncharacterized protein n=1 Tax=Mycobacterium phage Jung TaxID=2742107 RepID=A0AAE7F862_9CAUD|nr:head-tail connector protein [Mycobacterium phage Jung]QKY80170.1 hypothetical protein SEA_JUNG_10 [Mycobacterium phage Jung]
MSSYTIADEFLVLRDGSAVHYTSAELGATIELTDDEAAPLLAEGKLQPYGEHASHVHVAPYNMPEVFTPTGSVEVQGEVAERPDDAEPGEQLDSEGAPEPAIEAEPQPRRGRRRS